jgi:hypothetical protein
MEISVRNAAELDDALAKAAAGETIFLEDGVYRKEGAFLLAHRHGSDHAMIRIMARNRGKAVLAGESNIHILQCSYVQVWGLTFRTERRTAVVLDGARHCRLTRNTFEPVPTGADYNLAAIVGSGSGWNRIERNVFGPKSDPGPLVVFDGDGRAVSRYDVIERNWFRDIGPRIANGLEAIRLGLSGISLTSGYATIQYNLFENCDGEPEIVSVKSCRNTIRYNTFLHSAGQVTARHGHRNRFYGNCFIGDGKKDEQGGFRIYGNDHRLFDNYMEKLTTDPLLIDGGTYDGGEDGFPPNPTAEELRKHWRVYRATVVGNTIVDCAMGITFAKRKPLEPVQCEVAGNVVANGPASAAARIERPKPLTRGDVGPDST